MQRLKSGGNAASVPFPDGSQKPRAQLRKAGFDQIHRSFVTWEAVILLQISVAASRQLFPLRLA